MSTIAINVLLDPDPATVERARAVNARLRENFPQAEPFEPFPCGRCR